MSPSLAHPLDRAQASNAPALWWGLAFAFAPLEKQHPWRPQTGTTRGANLHAANDEGGTNISPE